MQLLSDLGRGSRSAHDPVPERTGTRDQFARLWRNSADSIGLQDQDNGHKSLNVVGPTWVQMGLNKAKQYHSQILGRWEVVVEVTSLS